MESKKRCKNFTDREKIELIEVAKEFVDIIDNKKTDANTVEAKRRAWTALTFKFNAVSETGCRNEKQLHALYDNLKKKARKKIREDMCEIKSRDALSCLNTHAIDDKVISLSTPQLNTLENKFDTSAPYYNFDIETGTPSVEDESEDFIMMENENATSDAANKPEKTKGKRRLLSPTVAETLKVKKKNLNDKKKVEIQYQQEIMELEKRKSLLDLQCQNELMKLEKTKTLLNLDIELKKVLLENAKIELEVKKRTFNL